MKRLLKICGFIALSLALIFAGVGIGNYIDTQDQKIHSSAYEEIYEVQEEMSSLYLLKSDYETEKAEIEDKLAILEDSDEATDNEILALSQRLIAVEGEITRIQSLIDSLQVALDNLIVNLNSLSMLPSTKKISNVFTETAIGDYTYTAPANGYFQITCFLTTGTNAYFWTDNFTFYLRGTAEVDLDSCLIPCRAGDVIYIKILNTDLRKESTSVFVYAETI